MTCSCEFSWKITFKFKHLEHFKGYYIHTLTSTCLFVVFLDNWEINKISSNWLFFTLNIFSRLKVLTFLHLIWSLIGFHKPLSRTFLITLKKQFNFSQDWNIKNVAMNHFDFFTKIYGVFSFSASILFTVVCLFII